MGDVNNRRGMYLVAGWLVALPLLAPGCAVNREAEADMAAALARYERNRRPDAQAYTQDIEQPASRPSSTAPARDLGRSQREPRSLREYILLALMENPEIRAAEQTVRARYARVPQATALPDPMLMTKTLPEPVRTAEGDNYFVLGVQQKFPVPEKLDRAGRVAWQEARMGLEALQRVRLRVIADVKRAYFRLYIIDKTIGIDRANQDLLRGLIDAARAQVAAGRRSQDDVLRAQVELYNLESRLIELRQQRETVVAMLNRLLDRRPATPVPEPVDFALRRVGAELERLIGLAVERNPDLQRLREQIERDRQSMELAKLAYWPDFTLGFEWMQMDPRGAFEPLPNPQTGIRPSAPQLSEDGTDNWAIVFGMNVPIWFEKIQAGIREARSRLLASQHQYVGTRNRVHFEVEDALARVRAQRELAEIFDKTIIPQARQAFEVSRSTYTAGRGDFLFVIDNWQKWLTFTIQYHRALGELERSVADLEEALGMSLGEAGG
jgi:cobalt-zinc-cadmium efflux system outer membrane protein